MSKTTRWFGCAGVEGIGTVVRSSTARLPSSARAPPAPTAAKVAPNTESVNQQFRFMGRPSLSIVVDVVDDGQAVRIVANSGHRRDLLVRTEIDDEDRPAGRRGRGLARTARDDGVPAVGGHRGALRPGVETVAPGERNAGHLAVERVGASEGAFEI